MGKSNETLLTAALVAEIAGISTATLVNANREGKGPPRDPETKRYPAKAFGMWLCHERSLMPGQGSTYPYLVDFDRVPAAKRSGRGGAPSLPGLPQEPTRPTKVDEETRLKRAQADKVELELAERAGQLVAVDDVNSAWVDIVMRVKARLTRMPSALAQLVHGKSDVFEIQEVLESGVREALEEMSDDWRDGMDLEDGG